MVRFKHRGEKVKDILNHKNYRNTMFKYIVGYSPVDYCTVIKTKNGGELYAVDEVSAKKIINDTAILQAYTVYNGSIVGGRLGIRAPLEKDGLQFQYFVGASGDIISYNNEFEDYFFTNDTIVPVYGKEKVDKSKPHVYRKGLGFHITEELSNDVVRVRGAFGLYLPEGYTAVSYQDLYYGFVYTDESRVIYRPDMFTLENPNKYVKISNPINRIPMLGGGIGFKNEVRDKDLSCAFRAAIVVEKDGVQETLYSELVRVSI